MGFLVSRMFGFVTLSSKIRCFGTLGHDTSVSRMPGFRLLGSRMVGFLGQWLHQCWVLEFWVSRLRAFKMVGSRMLDF